MFTYVIQARKYNKSSYKRLDCEITLYVYKTSAVKGLRVTSPVGEAPRSYTATGDFANKGTGISMV